jgi:SnoaL-like domain
MRSDPFRAAVEAEDAAAMTACLADDIRFFSPVVFRPYEGKDVVAAILVEGAMKVFREFRYRDQLEDGDTAALTFDAKVGGREVQGLDLLRFDGAGRVAELTVMVRPMSGVHALAEEMGRRFEELGLGAPASSSG